MDATEARDHITRSAWTQEHDVSLEAREWRVVRDALLAVRETGLWADMERQLGHRLEQGPIVHCFFGGFGADWDVDDAVALVERAENFEWHKGLFGTGLLVQALDDGVLKNYYFDSVNPPKED